MSIIAKPYTFSPNTTISSSQANANFDTLFNDYNGGISAANLGSNSVTTAKIADDAVTSAKIGDGQIATANIADVNVTTGKIADAAVTPAKRTGGFFIGSIAGATLGSTGNKAITGVGFTPKLVRFTALVAASTAGASHGIGAMTSAAQFATWATDTTAASARNQYTTRCVAWGNQNSSTAALECSYVSMDADGFTINVDTASSAFAVAYECYA